MRTSGLVAASALTGLLCCSPQSVRSQDAKPTAGPPPPAALPPAFSNEELMSELRLLRSEVAETRRLKDQIIHVERVALS